MIYLLYNPLANNKKGEDDARALELAQNRVAFSLGSGGVGKRGLVHVVRDVAASFSQRLRRLCRVRHCLERLG